jgi:nucleotide-binding universal stress UspA family protein
VLRGAGRQTTAGGGLAFKSIVVGTDGSDTATEAVRQAVELAQAVKAKVELVSAYEPVPEARLRSERREAPEDVQWAINPKEDAETTLSAAAEIAHGAGVEVGRPPGETRPTRSSTSPRRATRI